MKRIVAAFLVVLVILSACSLSIAETRNINYSYTPIKSNGHHYMYSEMNTSSSTVREVTGLQNVGFYFLTNGNPYWATAEYSTTQGEWKGFIRLSSMNITLVHMRNMFFTNYTLKKGDRGTAIMWLQTYLNAAGYNAGSVDGIWGTNTTTAVTSFQRARGLTADGLVGRNTKDALLSVTGIANYANGYE